MFYVSRSSQDKIDALQYTWTWIQNILQWTQIIPNDLFWCKIALSIFLFSGVIWKIAKMHSLVSIPAFVIFF